MDVRVLPFWPRDHYIELAPHYWRITGARLDPEELELEIGWLTKLVSRVLVPPLVGWLGGALARLFAR